MKGHSGDWRRRLARELTRQARLITPEILEQGTRFQSLSSRIGFTGPPGAGKSSLIAKLAERRMGRGRKVGVLAIDPTSPVSHGSLLGDRIRMDAIADADALYFRSIPSGSSNDGLCRNVGGLLRAMEDAGFADVILETVGVGQAAHQVTVQVDTSILVLVPEAGDTIQAMKAGILELADIYVVNKADRPGAARFAGELTSILGRRRRNGEARSPLVITSAIDGSGVDALDEAIDGNLARAQSPVEARRRGVARLVYEARSVLERKLDEASADLTEAETLDLRKAYCAMVARIGSSK